MPEISYDGREWQPVEPNIKFLPANPNRKMSRDCYRAQVYHKGEESCVYCDTLDEAREVVTYLKKYRYLVWCKPSTIRDVVEVMKQLEM